MAASRPMRVLVQRVSSATVTVDGQVVGAIAPNGQGLLAFVGVTHTDGPENAQRLAEKLWKLRILDDEKSASDVNAPMLVVSACTTDRGKRRSSRRNSATFAGSAAHPWVLMKDSCAPQARWIIS